jgi:protocatechuate 3,4-dioxygenase beta subunit
MILRVKILLGIFVLFGLLACGGGGGGLEREGTNTGGTPTTGGGGTVDPTANTIQLVLSSIETGQTTDTLSEDNPLRLTATVTDSDGKAVPQVLVTFTFNQEGPAEFSNDSGSAPTNSEGVATIDLIVGQESGGVEVSASLSAGDPVSIAFTSLGTTQINEEPASLQLFSSSIQLASSGSDQIELLALVKDENNVLLENINVTFSADSGANLQLPDGGSIATTGPDGIARAFLNTLNQPENRTITVVASAAGLTETQTLDIQVVGTEININGATSLIINDPAPITINVVDSDGKGIANQTVNIAAVSGQLSNTTPLTSDTGQVTVNYTASAAGTDTITASALNVVGSFELVVQEDDFAFSAEPEGAVELGADAELSITWLKENIAFENGSVNLTSSRGVVITPDSVTDVDGIVSFVIQSSNAGFASISATGVDADGNQVSARTQVEFIATEADNIIVDGTPDSVGPSGQTSTITAVVRDPNGNLVKGKVINFVVDDVSGGTISPNQATTDRSGIASTVYTSNAVSSFEAVKVHATVADTPIVSSFTLLTVGDRAFDISVGTGRLIEEPEQSSYAKEFSVFVTDPDSNPVPNALMTFSAPPVAFNQGGVFRKGYWVWDDLADIYVKFVTASCPNEDVNGNGMLDAGEDVNGDGLLTPGNVVSIPSTGSTDDNGQALIDILYAKQFGGWVDVDIAVKAESAGSESAESQEYSLSVSVADLKVEGSPPPFSPYGTGANCTDTD